MPSHLSSAGRVAALADFWLSYGLIGAIALLGLASGLKAHEWYPLECCSLVDCYPVQAERVKVVQGGWLVESSAFIPYADARPSPDGQYHICRYQLGKGALIRHEGKPACFWAPMGAS